MIELNSIFFLPSRQYSIDMITALHNINGNIASKSDAGVYDYQLYPAHAVDKIYSPSAALLNSGHQEVEYNAFHKATTVYNNQSQRLVIDYGVDQQRMRTRFYYGHFFLEKTKYFAANYEKEVTSSATREINYISTPYGALAAFIKEGNNAGQMYYLYKDHLGSITHITNSAGTVLERRSFDAWGRPRHPDNWSYSNIPSWTLLDRGFTGHEHLPQFDLINMNGRMYDPIIGRFLSPDPYIQGGGTQSFNRYTYALNNPLKYTDPTGEKLKWWQWGLLGLGVISDPVTGGLHSMAIAATFTNIYSFATITATSASATMSAVDFISIWTAGWFKPNQMDERIKNWAMMNFQPINSLVNTFRYDNSACGFEWPMQVIHGLTGGEMLQDNIGQTVGHYMNLTGKIDDVGYYQGRMVIRTKDDALGGAVSLGHFILGDGIALSPNDDSQGQDGLDLFAHEFGHSYQSRITGPLYLLKYGIASIYDNDGLTEQDANRRGFWNLGINQPTTGKFSINTKNTYKWWEFMSFPSSWPFMWLWNY